MKFLELNKKRHAVKTFNNDPVDIKDLRTAIEIATLAPSAHNIQPWKFVVVKENKEQLAELMYSHNGDQGRSAQYVVALFTDTDLEQRSRDIARIGVQSLSEEDLEYYIKKMPARFADFTEDVLSDYLALNAGLVTMNFVMALTDQKIASNMILGFDKSKINAVLDIDKRFRPELLITVGYTDNQPEATYRLPVDEVIELR